MRMFVHLVNLALGKPCQQSSTYSGYIASKAVDNDTKTSSHTSGNTSEWWQVDLERPYYIKNILIHFGKGCKCKRSFLFLLT